MATFYVATTGNNSNPGTITQPFATLNRAWSAVSSGGDIIYLRSGTYSYAHMGLTSFTGKSGTSSNRILIEGYPGDSSIPIIDFSDYTSSTAATIINIQNANYIHLKKLHVRNLVQTAGNTTHVGFKINSASNNCTIEYCEADHIGGWGFSIYGGSNTNGQQSNNALLLNCDSHHNSDPISSTSAPYDGSDGFLINSYNGSAYPSMGTQFIGCRAWMNSDDGWDNRLFSGDVTYVNCWAFWNGYRPGVYSGDEDDWVRGGNGYGFKLGSKSAPHVTTVLRTLTSCMSFENRICGFQCGYSDSAYVFSAITRNCIAYHNGILTVEEQGRLGFNYGDLSAHNPGTTNTLINSLSYDNNDDYLADAVASTYCASDGTYSYWNQRIGTTSASDFVSVNSAGVDGPRGADGSLPKLDFLHLRSTSNWIDAGYDLNLTTLDADGNAWDSTNPSLGAYQYVSDPIPATPPVASFTADPTTTYINTTIEFTDTSSESPSSWMWVFGDGSTSTLQNPTHQYTTVGTYTVQLTVSNDGGNDTEVKTDYITITNPPTPPPPGDPPVAEFTSNTTNTYIGETIYFTDESLYSPTSWSWIFGDGTTSTLQNPTHIYANPGVYNVSLSVENEYGNDEEIKLNYMIVLNPNPPEGCLAQIPLVRFFII